MKRRTEEDREMREQNQNEKEADLGDNSDAQNKNIVMAGLSGLVDNIFKNIVKDVSWQIVQIVASGKWMS